MVNRGGTLWLCALAGAVSVSGAGDGAASAGVLFVDAALTTGANDGSSWANAFRGRLGLAAALAQANAGDQVWVADGVYAPTGPNGSRDASFVIPSGVAVYGGFAGGESDKAQRNPSANPAVLTGDLNSNDGPPSNGIAPNSGENSRHVVRFDGAAGARLDGVTVRAGNATGAAAPADNVGGNVRVEGGEVEIVGCVLERGRAGRAGASVGVLGGAVTLRDVVVRENRSDTAGSGVASLDGASVTISECEFVANIGGQGGGLYLGKTILNAPGVAPGSATVRASRFVSTHGVLGGAAGGGILNDGGTLDVAGSSFQDNSVSGGGGAIYGRGGVTRIDRCDFVGNSAPGDGGGAIFIDGREGALGAPGAPAHITNSRFVGNNGAMMVNFLGDARVVNCTVANNTVDIPFLAWPAFLTTTGSQTTLRNSIVWDNGDGTLAPSATGLAGSGAYVLSNNLIEAWTPAHGPGAFNADPLFVDAEGPDGVRGTVDDDLRLRPGSPARDAGDAAFLPPDSAEDLNGGARVLDGDLDGAALVDLGAIEATCPPDATGDGVVNFVDLNALLSAFGQVGAPGFTGADVDANGVVNFADLNAVLSAFGADCR